MKPLYDRHLELEQREIQVTLNRRTSFEVHGCILGFSTISRDSRTG